MSEHVTNEACPRCREQGRDTSQDNLGIYDDGHKWCWSCGYYVPAAGTSIKELESKLQQQQKENKYNDIRLPSDYNSSLPLAAKTWLMKYGITEREIHQNRIGWSQSHEAIVYPIFGVSSELLLVQYRSFSTKPNVPRFKTIGYPEKVFHIVGNSEQDTCVLVEDLISAIKVGRQLPAVPLWGSNISNERMVMMSKICNHLIIWLDSDKGLYAIARRMRAVPYFESVRAIYSTRDPKEYRDEEINAFLITQRKEK